MAVHCIHTHAFIGHELLVECNYTVQAFKCSFIRLLAIHIDENISIYTFVIDTDLVFEDCFEFVWLAHILIDHADVVVELTPALLLESIFVAIGVDLEDLLLVREPEPLGIH